jgi:hypothetical protein
MKFVAFALLAAVGATNSCATSSRGDAQVRVVDGNVCFSAVDTAVVSLSRLTVNQISADKTDWKTPPTAMWTVGIKPAQEPLEISPQNCLPYSQTPTNMVVVQAAQPLKMQTTYSVFLSGKPQPNLFNMLGYAAMFCLIPADDGKTIAAATVYDRVAQKWRDPRCTATAPR